MQVLSLVLASLVPAGCVTGPDVDEPEDLEIIPYTGAPFGKEVNQRYCEDWTGSVAGNLVTLECATESVVERRQYTIKFVMIPNQELPELQLYRIAMDAVSPTASDVTYFLRAGTVALQHHDPDSLFSGEVKGTLNRQFQQVGGVRERTELKF